MNKKGEAHHARPGLHPAEEGGGCAGRVGHLSVRVIRLGGCDATRQAVNGITKIILRFS